jgi:hypothetical protein
MLLDEAQLQLIIKNIQFDLCCDFKWLKRNDNTFKVTRKPKISFSIGNWLLLYG